MVSSRATESERWWRTALVALALALLLATGDKVSAAEAVADPEIVDHLEREMVFDPAIDIRNIVIESADGVVTLTGTVDNILEKERAARVAETVRGVRAVVNRIEVEPSTERSAQWLRKAVRDALIYDPAADSFQVDVSANDHGQVILTGNVDSWQERFLAESIAKGVSGVTSVRSEITVTPAPVRADAEIRPEIERRLLWDTLIDSAMIDVVVDQGKVSLNGVVGSAAEKRRAEQNAWVAGVKSIDVSGLKVEKWARDPALRDSKYVLRSDAEIRDAIRDALAYDPRVSGSAIEVEVENGVAVLSGVVDSIQARRAAEMDARNTVGVFGVESRLSVSPAEDAESGDVERRAREALARSALTEAREISVRVAGPVAYLSGKVDSYYEKAEAENVVSGVPGVNEVRNELEVANPEILTVNPYVSGWYIGDYSWYPGTGAKSTPRTDAEIAAEIRAHYEWSPYVDAERVNVRVEDGVAILTGTVESPRENEAAEANAFEGGAVSVVNKLRVRLIDDPLVIETAG